MRVSKDQHMMIDKAIIKIMVSAARIRPSDTVLEIGPGTGNLTRELARKAKKVVAIEIDRSFRPELKKLRNVKAIFGNALQELGREGLVFDKVVANIPYAICEPLLARLMEKDFGLAVLTVPKGFSGIMTARKGGRLYSRTSLIASTLLEIEVLTDVPRKAFDPPPKTDSVVIRLTQKSGNLLLKEVLKRQKLKTKNAIMRSLFAARKNTKNQAKKAIKTLKLNNNLLEKRLLEADLAELDAVLTSLEKL